MGHDPRKDNALFWALAVGILATTVTIMIAMITSFVIGELASSQLAYLSYATGAVAGAIAFYVTWKRGEAKQRAREGRCLNCGYDLTGNVSGRCPECGTPT